MTRKARVLLMVIGVVLVSSFFMMDLENSNPARKMISMIATKEGLLQKFWPSAVTVTRDNHTDFIVTHDNHIDFKVTHDNHIDFKATHDNPTDFQVTHEVKVTQDNGSYSTTETNPENEAFLGMGQEDPRLVSYVRNHLLDPPSKAPYRLKQPEKEHFSQFGQTKYANTKYLHNMKGGFFVEVGAVDGEYLSNTLFLERRLGWTGLLIEPFPNTYRQLRHKHRKAYSINAALATTNVTAQLNFQVGGGKGVLSHLEKNPCTPLTKEYQKQPRGSSVVPCNTIKVNAIPFYTMLTALNVTVVDFLSLDIEGDEVKVLQTFPFDKIQFRLMCVEINHIPEGLRSLIKLLKKNGYNYLGPRGIDAWFGLPHLLAELRKDDD